MPASLSEPPVCDPTSKLRPLDAAASTPLWLQLKHALRDFITFSLRDDARIPSEAALCVHYGLSRVTVRQAITSLVDEGLLLRQQGRGTFVCSPRITELLPNSPHFLLGGFDAAEPSQIAVFSVETVDVPGWIVAKAGMAGSRRAFKIRKVLSVGNEPVASRTTYVPVRLVPKLLSSDLRLPLARTVEAEFGLRPQEAEETMEFIVADAFRADMLKVAVGHPLILVERTLHLASGDAVECSRTFYKADRFRFRHVLRRRATIQEEALPLGEISIV